jgi:hypothetical protein
LNGPSKPSLIALFIDLLTLYFNDKNSSKLRELTTLWMFGYNGYRMDADTGRRVDCEVKPQNTDDPRKKLNGGGSFNDYTLQKFSKDLENNPIILVSGFVGGKLIYIFEFKFECLKEKLKGLLERRFPKGQRKEGEYLRSAGFSFRNYNDCPSLKLAYLGLSIKGLDKIL